MNAAERSTSDGAFCWQTKEALRRIRQVFDQSHDVCSALSVYLALSEVASNNGRESFTTTQGDIGQRAGLSVRKVADVLRKLHTSGLVRITDNYLPGSDGKARAPSTFTMLATSRNDCTSSRNNCGSSCMDGKQPSLPSNTRKNKERSKESAARRNAKATASSEEEVTTFVLSLGLPGSDGIWFFNKCEGNGWKNRGQPIRDWKATIRSWQSASYLPSQKSHDVKTPPKLRILNHP